MASVIKDRTISSVSDKRIVMSNSTWARPIPFGTNWTKIRVGLRWHIRDPGADVSGTPRLAVGICSGSTNIFGDSTTTHFCGVRTNDTVWTRTTEDLLLDGLMWLPIKKVTSTITSGTGFFSGIQWGIGNGAAAATADRTIFFCDITKGSPNYTFQLFGWINATPVTDQSDTTFRGQMEVSGTPVASQHQQSVTQTLAVSEADGTFDHINVAWDKSTPELEICDNGITRLA